MREDHIEDMEMVDFILNNLSKEEADILQLHIEQCSICQREYNSWLHLLLNEDEVETIPSTNEHFLTNEKERIKYVVKNKFSKKKSLMIASSLIAVIFLMGGLYKTFTQNTLFFPPTANEGYIIAQQDEVPDKRLIEQPETMRQLVLPLSNNENINGEMFLNKETNEIVFLAEGLIPLQSSDYQLWVVHEGDYWNGQLLHLRNGSARVYYKGEDITLLKYFKISVEPQGGSLTPTGPEIFYVDFNDE